MSIETYEQRRRELEVERQALADREAAIRKEMEDDPDVVAARARIDELTAQAAAAMTEADQLRERLDLDMAEADEIAARVTRAAIVEQLAAVERRIIDLDAERDRLLDGIDADSYPYVAAEDAALLDELVKATMERGQLEYKLHSSSGWEDVDLSIYDEDLDSDAPLEGSTPTLLLRNDGTGIFYRGVLNGVFGEGEGGKTWLAVVAMHEEVRAGRHVMMIDFENAHAQRFKRRLCQLRVNGVQLDPKEVDRLVHWKHPTMPGPTGEEPVDQLINEVLRHGITLVVIDSVGESLALTGKEPNSDGDVARWVLSFIRPLMSTGCTILTVDHVTKANKKSTEPSGSARKYNAASAMFRVDKADDPTQRPAQGKPGYFTVACTKDREGGSTRAGAEQMVAEVYFKPVPGTHRVEVTIKRPIDDGVRAAREARSRYERLIDFVAANPGSGTTEIRKHLGGNGADVDKVRDDLVERNVIRIETGQRGKQCHYLAVGLDAASAKDRLNSFVPLVLNGAASN